ncbi:MAG: hypothetical protein ACI87E_000096 [Mariniblastus sp.]|jgi:hypothetical protein
MTNNSSTRFQFASDFDGDLYLFPMNLDEPDYERHWHVWVILADGSRKEAPLEKTAMCVNDGEVTNPLGDSGHQMVAGWNVNFMYCLEIEIRIGSGPSIRIPHPWK